MFGAGLDVCLETSEPEAEGIVAKPLGVRLLDRNIFQSLFPDMTVFCNKGLQS